MQLTPWKFGGAPSSVEMLVKRVEFSKGGCLFDFGNETADDLNVFLAASSKKAKQEEALFGVDGYKKGNATKDTNLATPGEDIFVTEDW